MCLHVLVSGLILSPLFSNSAEEAMRFPVLTFSSGPTNSMRGAAFLSGLFDGIVVDIGGTTTDVGVLKNGFPRDSSTHCMVWCLWNDHPLPNAAYF